MDTFFGPNCDNHDHIGNLWPTVSVVYEKGSMFLSKLKQSGIRAFFFFFFFFFSPLLRISESTQICSTKRVTGWSHLLLNTCPEKKFVGFLTQESTNLQSCIWFGPLYSRILLLEWVSPFFTPHFLLFFFFFIYFTSTYFYFFFILKSLV